MLRAMVPVKIVLGLALLVVGCGPQLQRVKIVNATNRSIDEIYLYAPGAANQGASRGTLAAGASTTLEVARGFVEIRAVSAKVKIDERVDERRSATSGVEVKRPVEVVFYDEATKPTGLERIDVIGVPFVPDKSAPPPEPTPSE